MIIRRIFSIPTDQLLLTFLAYSNPLREFYGFTQVPDTSKITRFKQDFLNNLQLVFDNLVDITEPICQAIDAAKADTTIFDSSGIEAFVTEYNPKYANRIISNSRRMRKLRILINLMIPTKPLMAPCSPMLLLILKSNNFISMVIFAMSLSLALLTIRLGIIHHISFYNKDFMMSHPNIVAEKKSDSPDEDKCIHDSKLLIPTLKDSFPKHPPLNPKTFLGNAALDTTQLYKSLLSGDTFGNNKHFSKAYIPLNIRSRLKNQDYSINEYSIPCCTHDPSLPMKYECTSKLKSSVNRFKFVCPKMI